MAGYVNIDFVSQEHVKTPDQEDRVRRTIRAALATKSLVSPFELDVKPAQTLESEIVLVLVPSAILVWAGSLENVMSVAREQNSIAEMLSLALTMRNI